MTIAGILASVGQVFTAATGWVGSVATIVTEEPIILLFVTLSLVGLGVGLFKRLINC